MGKSKKKPERRRAPRLEVEGLSARYWTGGLSVPHVVREISVYGGVISSRVEYYPGTTIRMALEIENGEAGESSWIGVWGKVLRNIGDAFCVTFVFESSAERREFRRFLQRLEGRSRDETYFQKAT